MARQLWLLRHGDAEDHGTRHDAERRLTEKGEAQARTAAKALKALEIGFDAIYTSPRVRARDTARPVADALGLEPLIHQPLNAGFTADHAAALFDGLGPDARLLLVGHNPDFAELANDLTGARLDFKKGGVAAIRLEGSRRGELIVLLRPKELERTS
jgi:phosphohistidine phosphatase